ncbi:MAG: hypothetical protein KDA38_06445 [Planctomycetales bacterium]|nr:hypothetical protein [Planctomycetales bacterium]
MSKHATRLMPFGRGLIVAALVALTATHAFAAPPTVAERPHPYDPDWPEIYILLNNKCVKCHNARDEERTDLSSYEAMIAADMDGERVVVPGQPDKSLLWEYVAWNALAQANSDLPDEPQMPEDRHEWLTNGQMETLHRWISNGALEYKLPNTCDVRPLMEMDFPSAKQCAACHPRQYEQWSRSMHAYAQHSPVFEAFNLTLVERTAGTIGTFCTRCHTNIGTSLGENESVRNVHRSRISMEGVTCVTCHRRAYGHYKSSSRVAIEPGGVNDACIFGPFENPVSEQAGSHPSKPSSYIRTSQFCGECHDVTNPEGIRLEEAFSEWHNSPAAKNGITCHHCHMGPVQGLPIPEDHRPLGPAAVVPGIPEDQMPLRRLSDHTFAGPDYSLLPDTEFPLKLDWMYEVDYRDPSKLTPYQQRTLLELRRSNRESNAIYNAKRYELLRNGARIKVTHPSAARPGDPLPVRVDVVSTTAGHSFPTGFTAERQLWISVELRDPSGKVVFASGDLDHNADLRDDHSHEVLAGKIPRDRYLMNFQNKFTALTNKGTDRTVVLSVNRHLAPLSVLRPANGISASFGRPAGFRIAKASLPPLKTIGREYPIRASECRGPHHLHVRLNFRHLPPTLLDHIGVPHLKHLLEVVVIDEYQCVVHIGP